MALFDEWWLDLGNASGPFSPSDKKEWRVLCADLGTDADTANPAFTLFALHTYFALVVKLVSVVILEGATGQDLFAGLKGESDIRQAFNKLEQGVVTSSVGALNVVEPGLFSWYVREGGQNLETALTALVNFGR